MFYRASSLINPRLSGAICCFALCLISLPAYTSLIGVLPKTPGGTDWQAYYDDLLDISWAADANIAGASTWDDAVAWVGGLEIGGVGGWRLPNMDVDGDGVIVTFSEDEIVNRDNEYSHLFNYGANTTPVFGRGGVTSTYPSPFTNVQGSPYWSGTLFVSTGDPVAFDFLYGVQGPADKHENFLAWAVHAGNVSLVPVPAALWLFGSGLIGLIGIARRKNA